jgi:hypothetical protein
MNQEIVEFDIWFGIAAVGLLWACLQIVLARRALNQVRREFVLTHGNPESPAVAEVSGSLTA